VTLSTSNSDLKLLQKLQSLDYQEANVEWERWAVSDSDISEERTGIVVDVCDI